jgi:hypothetical protein
MSVRYCSEACQANHWRNGGHRSECSRLRKLYHESIPIDISSITRYPTIQDIPSFQKPSYVAFDEPFTIKVERYDRPRPLLHFYDKELCCDFYLDQMSNIKSFDMLLAKVKAEPVSVGTSIYLEASFDQSGMCSIFLNRRKVKTW